MLIIHNSEKMGQKIRTKPYLKKSSKIKTSYDKLVISKGWDGGGANMGNFPEFYGYKKNHKAEMS